MYLWVSKYLDEPAHTRSLIDAYAFLMLCIALVCGVFYCICLSFLILIWTDLGEIKEEKMFV